MLPVSIVFTCCNAFTVIKVVRKSHISKGGTAQHSLSLCVPVFLDSGHPISLWIRELLGTPEKLIRGSVSTWGNQGGSINTFFKDQSVSFTSQGILEDENIKILKYSCVWVCICR